MHVTKKMLMVPCINQKQVSSRFNSMANPSTN